MSPATFALLLAALCTGALCLLCLAMRRHALTGDARLAGYSKLLRMGGWTTLTVAAALAVFAQGWGLGSVWLFSVLTPSGLIVAAFATYRPRALAMVAAASATLALGSLATLMVA